MYPLALDKAIHTISEHRTSAVEEIRPKTGYVERMLKKWRILDIQKYVIESFSLPLNLEQLSESVCESEEFLAALLLL